MLRAEHIFGRDPQRADTVLRSREASAVHAMARWRRSGWEVVDFSRNGTLLAGERLEPGQPKRLAQGQELCFGANESWQVVDTMAPGAALVPLQEGMPPLPLEPHNLLPAAGAPRQILFEACEGVWMLEEGGAQRRLSAGDTVTVQGRPYRLFLGDGAEETLEQGPMRLKFRVSQDEEHTWLQLCQGTTVVDLDERAHHYALLTLARQRLADARQGRDAQAQGWLERQRLARMLGMDVAHLNIQLYRARDQLRGAMPCAQAAAQVLEVRRGELRLGSVDVDIHRGARLEGRLHAGRADPP